MRPMNEIEIELPQIVLDRADAAYVQIRQQAAQEKQLTGKRFPRAAGILLAVVILYRADPGTCRRRELFRQRCSCPEHPRGRIRLSHLSAEYHCYRRGMAGSYRICA